MANRKLPALLVLVGALSFAGCEPSGAAPSTATAQSTVEGIASKNPNVVRLSLHAVPQGKAQLEAVASTSADKRGKPSDPEDQKAFDSGEEVVLEEKENLDVTIPIKDAGGKRVAVAGVTLKMAGKPRDQVLADARAIADQLSTAIKSAAKPLW